jgi:magnesium and cobalt exporter, CNNM family
MIDLLWIIPLMLVLAALKAFFSGSEIAMVSADKIRTRHKASRGDRGAADLLKLEQNPEMHLATTLIGTNVSIVALTTLGTIVMMRLLGEQGEVWAILLFSPLFLIFTEVVPKSVFQQHADRLAPIVVRPIRVFMYLIYPFVFGFALVARLAARMAGGQPMHHVFMTREMMRAMLDASNKASEVSILTWNRLKRALRLSDITVGEVMIPMAEVTAVSRTDITRHAIDLACAKGHFRLPVYEDQISQVIGVLAMDVWQLMHAGFVTTPLEDLIEPAEFVIAQQPVHELLTTLKQRNDRMAIVLDEFGSAIGMVTLEDIQEEVLGDFVGVGYNIPGYVHRSRRGIEEIEEGVYLVDGRLAISEINEMLALHLPTKEAHTVGGFLSAELRHMPKADESLDADGYRFTVVEATGKFVRRIRIEPV